MSINQFKQNVITAVKSIDNDDLIESGCPHCYGNLTIPNSHKCSEGWELYYSFYKKEVPIKIIVSIISQWRVTQNSHLK